MNKNILAIAIAAAVAAPSAFAAATVYGNAHMSVNAVSGVANDATNNGGVSAKSDMTNVTTNSSFFGVKGSEDLGAGLKAVYQMEFGVAMDGENTGASNFGDTNRNTFVGLGGGFGTVLLGRHDSPIKMVGRKYDLFGDQTGNNRNILGGAGNTHLVDGRHSNVIAYSTPTFNGFQALIAYVPGATTDSKGNEYDSTADRPVNAWSANGMYKLGNFDAAVGYITASNVLNVKNSYEAYRLAAGYSFGAARIVGLYQNAKYDAGTNEKSRGAYGVGASYKVSSVGTVKGQYYVADNSKGLKDGANMITVGYDHAMSKNTTVYALYALADNNKEGNFTTNMSNAGTGDNTTAYNPTTGSSKDNSAFSVGVQHKF